MTDNPYAPPKSATSAVGVISGDHEDVLAVARFQKVVLVCILIYFVAILGQGAIPQAFRLILLLTVGIAAIVGAVFVFRLAIRVYGTVTGICLGILSLVPLIGLVVLLSVNGKATRILRDNGITVGLLGAKRGSMK